MSDDDWTLDEAALGGGEWVLWNTETAEDPRIVAAVEAFEPHSTTSNAASDAAAWLKGAAKHESACITRLLMVGDRLAAFYALASGEVTITSGKARERMGVQGGERVGSSHVEWIARDRRTPPGAGDLALKHAIYVATEVATLQGNCALTLDPFDAETSTMWKRKGFAATQTEIGNAGLRRLYLAVQPLWR
jgi:hypothetical protein